MDKFYIAEVVAPKKGCDPNGLFNHVTDGKSVTPLMQPDGKSEGRKPLKMQSGGIKKREGEFMKQSVTSANTSINKNRMPAAYGKIRLTDGDRVLDYGCGRYTEHLYHHCKENFAGFFPFDPFNIPEWKNRLSREQLENRPATIGIMSNVLNVIDSDEAIKDAVSDALSLISNRGKLHITVYEGDKSGVGKYTSADSFQRNMRLKEYLPMLQNMGFDATMQHGTIVINGTHTYADRRKIA